MDNSCTTSNIINSQKPGTAGLWDGGNVGRCSQESSQVRLSTRESNSKIIVFRDI